MTITMMKIKPSKDMGHGGIEVAKSISKFLKTRAALRYAGLNLNLSVSLLCKS